MAKKFTPDPTWRYRRRAVGGTLLGCLGLIILAMLLGTDMTQVVIVPLSTLAGSALAFYVGGSSSERILGVPSQAKYEDKNA